MSFLNVAYIPKDLHTYLAFIRQFSEEGQVLWIDPFTTESQSPRFLLLFHLLLGVVSRITHLPPQWTLELFRLPLLFLLLLSFWQLLEQFQFGRNTKITACVLLAASGGIEWVIPVLAKHLPQAFVAEAQQSTWDMYGWNTFASSYNPLWLISLCIGLRIVTLAVADTRLGKGAWVELPLLFFLLFWIHPYSAVTFAVIFLALPLFRLLFRHRPVGANFVPWMAGLLPVVLSTLLLLRWQQGEPAFASASRGFFGNQGASPLWYPITLGALLPIALLSWKRHSPRNRPLLLAWILPIIFLHSSKTLNGYHFVFYLHPALCVWCAPLCTRILGKIFNGKIRDKTQAILLASLLFFSPLFQTLQSIRNSTSVFLVPAEYNDIIETLSELPQGRVFCSPLLGNMIPAYTNHRVFVGHWFLTPEFPKRRRIYYQTVSSKGVNTELSALLWGGGLDYLILPRDVSKRYEQALPGAEKQKDFDSLSLLKFETI